MSYIHTVVPIDQIRPHPRNARIHAKKQIRQIAASIRAVGFAAPVHESRTAAGNS
jgi:ParB-like chromosome segregation protein Spo0J